MAGLSVRILVVKLSSIGDVVHGAFAAAVLARLGSVDWLVGEPAAPVVRALPFVRRTFVLGKDVHRLAAELREEGYDLAVDLQGLLRSSTWTVLSGASRRVGRGRWPWLHDPVGMFDGATPHAIENTARVLAPLGLDPGEAAAAGWPVFAALGERLRDQGARLVRLLALPSPFRVWIPGARWPSKRLPPARLDAADVLVGGSDKADSFPGATDLRGRLGLLDSVAICLAARDVVAADTGPAHLAAVTGARIAGCYGPTQPARTGLRGPRATSVAAACGGCLRRRCLRARRCMAEAVAGARSLLEDQG